MENTISQCPFASFRENAWKVGGFCEEDKTREGEGEGDGGAASPVMREKNPKFTVSEGVTNHFKVQGVMLVGSASIDEKDNTDDIKAGVTNHFEVQGVMLVGMMKCRRRRLDRVATTPAVSRITDATLTHGLRGGDWVRHKWFGCTTEGECVFLSREGEGAKWWWSAPRVVAFSATPWTAVWWLRPQRPCGAPPVGFV
ncbi:hypothetical protein V8G54_032067 [Vigna mungo]|uniref:Uncharacterized protein n=1 Tax=Vigna mungo TaxID=3915 RepID=A0AAQ3MKF9_VIGMU